MMIQTLLTTLVTIAATYAAEQHDGILLRGAGGNIPDLLGAEKLVDVGAKKNKKNCTYFSPGSDDCPVGNYCDIGKGTCMDTGVLKQRGVCKPMPSKCPTNKLNMVCGCDGSTWSSPCEAAKFAMNIKHMGVCSGNDYDGESSHVLAAED
ncbi:hypothetical protein ACHAXA_003343 [Cyclostephanos tholiformis]|uniref:Kazal-like domain-containing protein n=1 Tax=Cyclostephanos tholiformis TaxID=382380 RepID=A0ABD3RD51_9STRA